MSCILQAWKGDVTQLSGNTYSVTSKCYNNLVFACQCLQIGYLVKHETNLIPNTDILYNGAAVPPCADKPLCNGASPNSTTTTTTTTT